MEILNIKINDKLFYYYKYYFNLNLKKNQLKIIIFSLIIIIINYYYNKITIYNLKVKENYLNVENSFNISFDYKIYKKIKIGIVAHCIKNGGRARITALLINNLIKINIFKIFLFTRLIKEDNEYIIPDNIKRILIKKDFINIIKKNKISILLYQLDNIEEINLIFLICLITEKMFFLYL